MIIKNTDSSMEYVISKKKEQINVFFRYKGYGINFIETTDSMPSYIDFDADRLETYLGVSTMNKQTLISQYYNGFVYFKLYSLSIADKILKKARYKVKRIRLNKIFSLLGIRELSLILNVLDVSDDITLPSDTFNEYKQFLVEMIETSIKAFPLKLDALSFLFDHAIDYGVVSGVDLFFKNGYTGGEMMLFRLKEQDYITAKNFKIWAMAACGWKVVVSDDEWTDFVKFVIENATKQTDDPISPPVITLLCNRLSLGNIYTDETNEFMDSITSGGAMAIGLLQDGVLTVPTTFLTDVVARIKGLTMRKARQLIMPYLDEQVEKGVVKNFYHKDPESGIMIHRSVRVWRFKWDRLIEFYPELSEKQLLNGD